MKKVCKKCKIFVNGPSCPLCKGTSFADSWKGRLCVVDVNKSEIAKKIGIRVKGEYAIKVR